MKKKNKRAKRELGCVDIHPELKEIIKSAAKAISTAKKECEETISSALLSITVEMNCNTPKEASETIMEDVEHEISDNTPENWEKQLTIYVRNQFIEWEKDRLNEEIKAIEAERDKL